MANIPAPVQAAIDALAASLGLENPGDAGSVASWKRTFSAPGGYVDAVPGTYYFAKVTITINRMRADATLNQVSVERFATFLGVP